MKGVDFLISVPCYDRKIHIETATSITSTVLALANQKMNSAIFTVSGCAMITHARNAIVTEFMGRREKTHLLFVDADMEWSAHTVLRLLKANVPFAAAPYVQKKYRNVPTSTYQPRDLDAFHGAVMDWNVEFKDPGILSGQSKMAGVHDGFVKVSRIGAGLMLLRRDMLEAMAAKYAHTEYRWDGPMEAGTTSRKHLGLFDLLKTPDGGFVGEDYAFCNRWVDGCAGEIWCDIDARVGHHGHHRYAGSLRDSLRLRSRATA